MGQSGKRRRGAPREQQLSEPEGSVARLQAAAAAPTGFPWPFRAAMAAVFILIAVVSFFPVQSDDIFMYLAIVRRTLAERGFPKLDPFLFSIPNYHWHILHEWAAHFFWYASYSLAGWTGVIIAKVALILATAGVVAWAARAMRVRSPLVPLLLMMALAAASHRLIERSSLFSDLFTAAVLAIVLVERSQRAAGSPVGNRCHRGSPPVGNRCHTMLSCHPVLLPVIFLFWVNLHPGFYPGLAICGLAVLCDAPRWREPQARRFAFYALASVVAVLFNPLGPAGAIYPLKPLLDPDWDAYRASNYEWMSTWSEGYRETLGVQAFLLMVVVAAVLLIFVFVRGRLVHARQHAANAPALSGVPVFECLVLILFARLGFTAVRFVPTAAFALCVLATALLGRLCMWRSFAAGTGSQAASGTQTTSGTQADTGGPLTSRCDVKGRRAASGTRDVSGTQAGTGSQAASGTRAARGRQAASGTQTASGTERFAARARPIACGLVAVTALALSVKVAFWGYPTLAAPRHVGAGLDSQLHPVAAADFIDRIDLRTNLFNQHEFGSYLAWRWDGRRKLFYHGFVDDLAFYARNYLTVNESEDEFRRVVREFNLGAFLLTHMNVSQNQGPPLYRLLLTSPEWRLVYADGRAMLFLRDMPENRESLAKATALAKQHE